MLAKQSRIKKKVTKMGVDIPIPPLCPKPPAIVIQRAI